MESPIGTSGVDSGSAIHETNDAMDPGPKRGEPATIKFPGSATVGTLMRKGQPPLLVLCFNAHLAPDERDIFALDIDKAKAVITALMQGVTELEQQAKRNTLLVPTPSRLIVPR